MYLVVGQTFPGSGKNNKTLTIISLASEGLNWEIGFKFLEKLFFHMLKEVEVKHYRVNFTSYNPIPIFISQSPTQLYLDDKLGNKGGSEGGEP